MKSNYCNFAKIYFLFFVLFLGGIACSTKKDETTHEKQIKEVSNIPTTVELKFLELTPEPVIGENHPDGLDIEFGFEGGTAHKVNGKYYLFSTESFEEPKSAAVRLALWTSEDGTTFSKHSVITGTNFDWYDSTHRMSTWSPMVVFDDKANRYSLFHVGYRRKPNATNVFNMSGKILRLDSETLGREGITGPYKEGEWLDVDDNNADWWEGDGKFVSFYPYKLNNEWWGFYGSNSVPQHISAVDEDPNEGIRFFVGLIKSEGGLTDKWVRQKEYNPVLMDSIFVENPVVTKVHENLYLLVYDGYNRQEISYSWSTDGIHWKPEQLIKLEGGPELLHSVRTPLGLINEGNGVYSIYFTAFDNNNPDNIEPLWVLGRGNMWLTKVRLDVKY